MTNSRQIGEQILHLCTSVEYRFYNIKLRSFYSGAGL